MPDKSSTCTFENCTNQLRSSGYCMTHYAHYKEGHELKPIRYMATRNKALSKGQPCTHMDCEAPIVGRGLCSGHYSRLKNGIEMESPVRRRDVSYFYKDDKKYYLEARSGYVYRMANDQERTAGYPVRILEHREAMEVHLGRRLLGKENVHHINGIRDDNRIENLELWSTSQPSGQRVEDKIAWAKELLEQYGHGVNLV